MDISGSLQRAEKAISFWGGSIDAQPTGMTFNHLTDGQFEELTYDLLHELGFVNLDWRRGSGKGDATADQGRDVVGEFRQTDVDGSERFEKWFVQCKRYQRGVPAEALNAAVAWASAESPAVLLFVVSNSLSNPAKAWLENLERNRRPAFRVKVWERRKLEQLVGSHPALIAKYKLKIPSPKLEVSAIRLRQTDLGLGAIPGGGSTEVVVAAITNHGETADGLSAELRYGDRLVIQYGAWAGEPRQTISIRRNHTKELVLGGMAEPSVWRQQMFYAYEDIRETDKSYHSRHGGVVRHTMPDVAQLQVALRSGHYERRLVFGIIRGQHDLTFKPLP